LSRVIDEHRQFLSDHVRLAAFAKAIDEVVQVGDTVLDLGSGTGILALLACRAGAHRVYSIESSGIIQIAREIAQANGFNDRIVFVKGLSTRVTLPEPVDVIVGDQIGRMGFEAGLLDDLSDARERFLKPGGRLVPETVSMMVAPIERSESWSWVSFWEGSTQGFDFSAARRIASNTGYPTNLNPEDLLGSPVCAWTFETKTTTNSPLASSFTLPVERNGHLHGLGVWFEAMLSKSSSMTNSPLAGERINRRNVFLPIERPVEVKTGDRVEVRLHVRPQDLIVSWSGEVWKASAETNDQLLAKFGQSTFKGMLVDRDAIQRTEPSSVPRLTPWGEARRTILNLSDGLHTLAEIEQEVYSAHRKLFRTEGDAAGFVAEVIPGYSL